MNRSSYMPSTTHWRRSQNRVHKTSSATILPATNKKKASTRKKGNHHLDQQLVTESPDSLHPNMFQCTDDLFSRIQLPFWSTKPRPRLVEIDDEEDVEESKRMTTAPNHQCSYLMAVSSSFDPSDCSSTDEEGTLTDYHQRNDIILETDDSSLAAMIDWDRSMFTVDEEHDNVIHREDDELQYTLTGPQGQCDDQDQPSVDLPDDALNQPDESSMILVYDCDDEKLDATNSTVDADDNGDNNFSFDDEQQDSVDDSSIEDA